MASQDWSDSESVGSSVAAPSEVSTVPDKFGFLGGAQYTDESEEAVPVEVIRRREKKWLEMFSRWDSYMLKRYKKVRDRCRKGVPSALRARAWQHLCGAQKQFREEPRSVSATGRVPSRPKAGG